MILHVVFLRCRCDTAARDPDVADLRLRCYTVASAIRGAMDRLRGFVDALGVGGIWRTDIRAPLDVVRDAAAVGVPWRPLMLSELQVGSQRDLVDVLLFARDAVAPHTRPPLPLVVDENIHYRILRLRYGSAYADTGVAGALAETPPLYGVWHPYKYVVTLVWRAFHPFMLYARAGTVAAGTQSPVGPRLRNLELLMAAMLAVPQDILGRLAGEAVRRRAEVVRLEALVDEARVRRRPPPKSGVGRRRPRSGDEEVEGEGWDDAAADGADLVCLRRAQRLCLEAECMLRVLTVPRRTLDDLAGEVGRRRAAVTRLEILADATGQG